MNGIVTPPGGIPGTEFVPRDSARLPRTAFGEVPVTAQANGQSVALHWQAP